MSNVWVLWEFYVVISWWEASNYAEVDSGWQWWVMGLLCYFIIFFETLVEWPILGGSWCCAGRLLWCTALDFLMVSPGWVFEGFRGKHPIFACLSTSSSFLCLSPLFFPIWILIRLLLCLFCRWSRFFSISRMSSGLVVTRLRCSSLPVGGGCLPKTLLLQQRHWGWLMMVGS